MKHFTRTDTIIQEVGEKFKRQVVIKRYRTEDGKEHEFTTFYREGVRCVAVVAITKDRQVAVTYEFRAGSEQWLYELPGGSVKEGEDLQVAALRELHEETGYKPGKLEYLGESMWDAYSNASAYYYLATDCTLSRDGDDLDREETEQGAELRLISIDDLIDNAKQNRMTDPRAVLMAYDQLLELKEDSK